MQKDKFYINDKNYATDMPLWKLLLFYCLTLSVYTYYWFYKNLRFIGKFALKKNNENINLGWLSLGLAVPIVEYFVVLFLFFYIIRLNRPPRPSLFLCVILYFTFTYLGDAGDYWWMLYSLNIIPILIMQNELNKYFRKEK